MRLLLAEDEIELSKALSTVLMRNSYSVDAVFNGQEALDYLESPDYDALILDIMMPIKDGIEVLQTIRAKGNKIPVLILTAKSSIDDRVLGLDLGADDYLTKPFATEELIARIRAITRRKGKESPQNSIRYENLKLDKATHEIEGPSEKIQLGNHEFQILETLMSNSENYFSIERLFEKIWGYDSDTESSVVWVEISNLRKKLKTTDCNATIKGKRNLGYRLEKLK
ncbi:MAG: response regulator transcription factor [Sphaerochaetaceae bacterium]